MEVLLLVLGAVLGYAFSVFQKYRETKNKREVLMKALREELVQIYDELPTAFDADTSYFRAPICLVVPPLLLDGEVLDYGSNAELIRALLTLQHAMANFNQMVTTANLTYLNDSVSNRATMFDIMQGLHKVVLRTRKQVLELLPLAPT